MMKFLRCSLAFVIPMLAAECHATPLTGTVPTAPGTTVSPGLVPAGTNKGFALATNTVPFSFATTGGTNSGTFASVVFRLGLTLDFYYQINNNASSATAIALVINSGYPGITIATGYLLDGSAQLPSIPGTFVDGTVLPATAGLDAADTMVSFSFNLDPGASSVVFVISTNGVNAKNSDALVSDGINSQTVASIAVAPVPEPASVLLLGGGLLGLAVWRRARPTPIGNRRAG